MRKRATAKVIALIALVVVAVCLMASVQLYRAHQRDTAYLQGRFK